MSDTKAAAGTIVISRPAGESRTVKTDRAEGRLRLEHHGPPTVRARAPSSSPGRRGKPRERNSTSFRRQLSQRRKTVGDSAQPDRPADDARTVTRGSRVPYGPGQQPTSRQGKAQEGQQQNAQQKPPADALQRLGRWAVREFRCGRRRRLRSRHPPNPRHRRSLVPASAVSERTFRRA